MALDRTTGDRRWATCLPTLEEHRLLDAVDGVAVLIAFGRGAGDDPVSLVAYDLESPEELWSLDFGDDEWPDVVARDGGFYLLGHPYSRELGLRRLDARTGEELWRVDEQISRVWIGEGAVVVMGPPVMSAAQAETSNLRALDPDNGTTVWTLDLDGEAGGAETDPQALTNRTTLVVPTLARNSDGRDITTTHAVDMATGTERWSAEFSAVLAGDSAALGGEPYEEQVSHAWDMDRGEPLWTAEPFALASTPYGEGRRLLRTGDLVAVELDDGYAMVNVRTGKSRWSEPLKAVALWTARDSSLVVEPWDTNEIAVVDAESGDAVWTAAVRDPELVGYVSGAVIDGDHVVVSVVNNTGV